MKMLNPIFFPLNGLSKKNFMKRFFCQSSEKETIQLGPYWTSSEKRIVPLKGMDLFLKGSAETVPEISLEKSVALSRESLRCSPLSPVYPEADPSLQTKNLKHLETLPGYKFSYSLEEKSRMLKAYCPRPFPEAPAKKEHLFSDFQQDVIYGLLLGKAFISKTDEINGKEYRFNYVDSIDKAPFVEAIYQLLSHVCQTPPYILPEKDYPGGGIGFSTIHQTFFMDLWREFYNKTLVGKTLVGKTLVPRHFSQNRSPRVRAYRFMHASSTNPNFTNKSSKKFLLNLKTSSSAKKSLKTNPSEFKIYRIVYDDSRLEEITSITKIIWTKMHIPVAVDFCSNVVDKKNVDKTLVAENPLSQEKGTAIVFKDSLNFKRMLLHYIHPSLLYKL